MATNNVLNHTSDFLSMPTPTDTGVGAIQANGQAILTTYNFNVIVGPCNLSELPPLTGTNNTIVGSEATAQNLTSGTFNIAIGSSALTAEDIGSGNIAIGSSAIASSSDAADNTAIGTQALFGLYNGAHNIAIGNSAGTGYTANESYNIILGPTTGTSTENNVMRLGSDGSVIGGSDTLETYIYGIDGVDVGNVATVVTESGDQLGTAVITAGTNISVVPTANAITINSTGGTVGTYTYVSVNSSPYVVLTTDQYISVDSSGGAITIQLPNAATSGQYFIVKDRTGSAATNNITVTTVGGIVNIDGATSFVMNTAYEAVSVMGNGTSYEIF